MESHGPPERVAGRIEKMSKPEVSVVMGVYNGAEHLEATLSSVLSQTDCDMEFIVVDDGSTDDAGRILDEWAARDGRLRVIHQQNTGLTRALIRGCAEAKGEYIARQDVGDVSLPGRLAKQVKALREDAELSFVSCHSRYVGPHGEFLYQQAGTGFAKSPVDIIDVRQLHGVLDGPSHHGSVMFRRDRYVEAGGYREQFYFGQDWDLWYRLGLAGKFQMLPETLYQARIGINDISTSSKQLQEEFAKLSLQSLKHRCVGQSDAEVLERASALRSEINRDDRRGRAGRGSYFLGECLRRNGEIAKARHYFWQSIKDNPANLKAWVRLGQTALKRPVP